MHLLQLCVKEYNVNRCGNGLIFVLGKLNKDDVYTDSNGSALKDVHIGDLKSNKNLDDLNDDCLVGIFEFLNIFDQMRAQKTCLRFANVIKSMWHRKQYKIEIDKNLLYFCDESKRNNDLVEYLNLNKDSLENLKLDRINGDQFEMLKPLRFPKVKTLDIYLWVDEYPTDKYTPQLIDMFPAVENLTLQSCITGIYLWEFKLVKDLNIDCCEFLDTNYFKRIFETLNLRSLSILFYGYNTCFEESVECIAQCKELEELRIDDHHLMQLIDHLITMPKLQRLTFCSRDYDDYLMQKIADIYGTLMKKIIYNDCFWSKSEHLESLLKMKNLETLVLIEDDIKNEHIEEVAITFKNLREFRFIKSRINHMDESILSIVENCTDLEILDVTESKVNGEFLQRLNCAVQKQKKRNVPLKLYCYGTDIAKSYTCEMPLSDQLKVIVEEHKYDTLGNRFIECIWTPIAATRSPI